MEREITRSTLKSVYHMLYEIGKGNLDFQIKRTKHRDELEGLIAILNLTVKRLNQSRHQFIWANRYNKVVVIRTASFILDKNFQVVDYNWGEDAFEELNNCQPIKGVNFENFLTKNSRLEWRKTIKKLLKVNRNFIEIELQYKFPKFLELRLISSLIQVPGNGDIELIVISSFLDTQKDLSFNLSQNTAINKVSIWDQQLFKDLEEYIRNHIQEPLKKTYELAAMFNTNEHKIKTGFKKVFGVTPYQYHRDQRIAQSKILIDNTDLTLDDIAIKMGFKTYPKFSRYFKREVKMTPRTYRQRSKNHSV